MRGGSRFWARVVVLADRGKGGLPQSHGGAGQRSQSAAGSAQQQEEGARPRGARGTDRRLVTFREALKGAENPLA